MIKEVLIIDYDMGNLFSVAQACRKTGINPIVTGDPDTIRNAGALILPGVGAFGDAMEHLEKNGQIDAINEFLKKGNPFLGICLGMQLLFSSSEEFGEHCGLGIIPGRVKKFPLAVQNRKVKVPQVAWNRITPPDNSAWQDTVLERIQPGEYMYFVHSYYCIPDDPSTVLTQTDYEGIKYCSSVKKENILAMQFHPEKSGQTGLAIYASWARNIK